MMVCVKRESSMAEKDEVIGGKQETWGMLQEKCWQEVDWDETTLRFIWDVT